LYLFYHDGFVLGGHTVYLPKLLTGLQPSEYMLIYSGSESAKQYIKESGIPESARKEFDIYGIDYFADRIANLSRAPKILRTVLLKSLWFLKPFIHYYTSIKVGHFLKALKISQYKKLVVNSGGYFGSMISRTFLKQAGLPCTYLIHNHIPEFSLSNKKLLGTVSDYVNHWIVGSKVIRDQLIEYCSINEQDISLVHYGFKPAFYPDSETRKRARFKLNIPDDTFVVLHPSVFEKRKGHYYTIRAFSELLSQKPNSRLILAGGEGHDREYVIKLVSKYKINDYVILSGFYSPFEELLSAADVLCLPSQNYDTTPGVIILALSCKVPVLTTDRKDFEGILFDEKNALLVPIGDYQLISEKLLKLENDEYDRASLVNLGYETYQKFFLEENMIEEIVKVIKTV
jgi:glycosyltransferase involved in cell wall biosynthesis